MDHLKKVVIKLNDFDANLSFNRDSFGSLALNESSILPFDSKILRQDQIIDLIDLCIFNASNTWTLHYRGSRDGFGAEDFHLKC